MPLSIRKAGGYMKAMTMEELLASVSIKPLNFSRGDQVQGEVVAVTDTEVIVDLGSKAEGIIGKHDFSDDELEGLQVGNKISAFVVSSENESGQIFLSLQKQMTGGKRAMEQFKRWKKFFQAKEKKSHLRGTAVEVNKGGVVVEIDGIRGFLPSSQIGLKDISQGNGLEGLIGKELTLNVIEVDLSNNRLIFSTREEIGNEVKEKLAQYEVGQKVKGKVAAIVPFGIFINIDSLEGMVYSQEISWEEVEDFGSLFEVGQEIEAQVIGKDEGVGRLNLSLRKLSEDPFEKMVENFEVDDVVKGTVKQVTTVGVSVQLKDGIEGFLQANKITSGTNYELGQEATFLIDSVDKTRRRINLAPFLTSTQGLLYR